MANRKLPTESECLEFAEHVAEDLNPKNGDWKTEEIEMYWFRPSQLEELIKFIQGQPVQNKLWKNL